MNIRWLACVLALVGPLCSAAVGEAFTSFFGFELDEATTLADVEKGFGPAPLIESGEAGEYEALICYFTDRGVVGFLSGEMGGPNHRLIGFSVAKRKDTDKCGTMRASQVPSSLTLGGLRLGMTTEQFSALFGPNIQWDDGTARHFIEGKERMTDAEAKAFKKRWPDVTVPIDFDTTVSIIGTFQDGCLIGYQVWRVRTT